MCVPNGFAARLSSLSVCYCAYAFSHFRRAPNSILNALAFTCCKPVQTPKYPEVQSWNRASSNQVTRPVAKNSCSLVLLPSPQYSEVQSWKESSLPQPCRAPRTEQFWPVVTSFNIDVCLQLCVTGGKTQSNDQSLSRLLMHVSSRHFPTQFLPLPFPLREPRSSHCVWHLDIRQVHQFAAGQICFFTISDFVEDRVRDPYLNIIVA